MYHWLLFDADNTLFDFNAAEAHSLRSTLALTDISWDEEVLAIYRAINHSVWSDYERGLLDKEAIRHLRFELLLERFRSVHDAQLLSEHYRAGLAASTHLMAKTHEVLRHLQPHYRLGLITNGLVEVQYPRLKNTGLDRYFQVTVVSDEIGVAKPHAAFFDHSFQLMGQPRPEEVLVIGDNPIADIGGALAYGCHACWFKQPGEYREPPAKPQHEIAHLDQLLALLLAPSKS